MSHGLADPTDAGNKPGDGPLRVGGESPKVGTGDANTPSTMSPPAQAQVQGAKICRDLWGGNIVVREQGQLYLPQDPGETSDNYRIRLNRSVLFNIFRQTVVGLVGLIFRRDPVLGDDVPEKITDHWENIDLAGTHGDVFVKQITEDAETVGHAAILVEFPETDGEQSREDEGDGGLRPYWVPVKKEQILSWRTDNVGGATVLTQVVIRFDTWVDVGEYGQELLSTYLVSRNDLAGNVTWQRLIITKDNAVDETGSGVYVNQTEIPIAEVITSGTLSLFVSTPPLLDVAFLNVAHYQMWSDYATAIHKANVPLLAILGIDQPTDGSGNSVAIVVGANTVLTLENPQADAKYVSHDGAALSTTRDALEDLVADMAKLGLSQLAPKKMAAETAEAKRIDKATSDSALAVTARGVQDAVEVALGYHANYMKLEGGGSVKINRDFEGMLMEAPVMQAYASLRDAGFPARFILKSLQEGGRVPEDEDLDALELEMDANVAAEEARKALEAEAAVV